MPATRLFNLLLFIQKCCYYWSKPKVEYEKLTLKVCDLNHVSVIREGLLLSPRTIQHNIVILIKILEFFWKVKYKHNKRQQADTSFKNCYTALQLLVLFFYDRIVQNSIIVTHSCFSYERLNWGFVEFSFSKMSSYLRKHMIWNQLNLSPRYCRFIFDGKRIKLI